MENRQERSWETEKEKKGGETKWGNEKTYNGKVRVWRKIESARGGLWWGAPGEAADRPEVRS